MPARQIVQGQHVTEAKAIRAREFRRAMTVAERKLWAALRRNQLLGLHFRRQQIIDGFIADFYCHAAGLVVEVDGPHHADQTDYDVERDRILAARNLHVLRLTDDEILRSLPAALQRIVDVVQGWAAAMMAVRKVDANGNAQRLFSFFDENSQNAAHARTVIAEGSADLWIVEDGGQLVGALLGRQMRTTDEEMLGGVDNLLVGAGHRRRGIGRRLMEEAEAHFQTEGLDGVQLAVNADNVIARSLYDSMGYQVIKQYTRRRHDASGKETTEHRLRMWKPFGSRTAG